MDDDNFTLLLVDKVGKKRTEEELGKLVDAVNVVLMDYDFQVRGWGNLLSFKGLIDRINQEINDTTP